MTKRCSCRIGGVDEPPPDGRYLGNGQHRSGDAGAGLRAPSPVRAVPPAAADRPIGTVFRPQPAVVGVSSNLDEMNIRVAALEKQVADQQAQIRALNVLAGAPVHGYTRAFITLGGFKTLPDTDGIMYYARQ